MVGAPATPAFCIAVFSSALPANAWAASIDANSWVTVTSFGLSAARKTASEVTPIRFWVGRKSSYTCFHFAKSVTLWRTNMVANGTPPVGLGLAREPQTSPALRILLRPYMICQLLLRQLLWGRHVSGNLPAMTSGARPDPLWFDAWRGILFANAKVLRAVEPKLQEHSGISLVFLDVLGRLYDAPGGKLRMQELQQRSLFTHSGMTRLVDRIEAAGLVRRESVPGDRRGVWVVITPEGCRLYEKALARHRLDLEQEFASRLTSAQQQAVAEALSQFWHE